MRIENNFNLQSYNSYQLVAKCRKAFFPGSQEDLVAIYQACPDPANRPVILGGGYNTILSQTSYDQDFIIIGEHFGKVKLVEETVVFCEAGASTLQLSEFAYQQKLSGAEIFYDIPSSIGGAIVMNAGASGEEIKDILIKVRYLDLNDNTIKELRKDELDFSYRNSFFQKQTDKIVLSGWLKLQRGNPVTIREKMDRIKEARWEKQPRTYPNAGSVFKRPSGHYVGALVENLSLKGYTVGGAKISEKHGGFIINTGKATGADILAIIKHVQDLVREAYGVELEIEQRIV